MAANKVYWWDAPKGYKAVKAEWSQCKSCAIHPKKASLHTCNHPCTSKNRKDQQTVIFVPRNVKS